MEEYLPFILVGVAVLIVVIIASGYVKAPPDKAYIISGLRKAPKILVGQAGIKIPFLERLDKLLLKQITIDVKTETYIPTSDYINISVDAVVKIRVSSEPTLMKLAMTNFLNKHENEIILDLQDSLQGNMREIIGTMSLKEINNNRDEFGNQVQSKAKVDMEKLGIEIISCNIQNITDKNGLIEDMGMDNTSKIKKDAAIAKAEADRDIAIAQSAANRAANEARVIAETEMAKQNNDLAIRQAELKKESDIKKAEADAAYEIQKEEQRKTIETTRANANIAKEEREIELSARKAEVEEKNLEATIKKKADADKYKAQQEADVMLYQRKKEAEAKRYEQEQEAEAKKIQAEANMFAKQKEAEGIRMVGEAEANTIRAKGVAEAEGIDKKAEAMAKMQEAAVLDMYFKVLPSVAKEIAAPLAKVGNITMYGEGNSSKLVEDITKSLNQVMEGSTTGLGIDIRAMLSSLMGVKLAENVIKNDDQNDNVSQSVVETTTTKEVF